MPVVTNEHRRLRGGHTIKGEWDLFAICTATCLPQQLANKSST